MLSSGEEAVLAEALLALRDKVRWKPGKDVVHHQKRQNMGHLPLSCSLAGYENLILDIVRNGQSIVYLYEVRGVHFYAVRGFNAGNEWLVIFGRDGVMETAFPPENMDGYLAARGFVVLGHLEEVLRWTKKAQT
jgi:hypothetical protein